MLYELFLNSSFHFFYKCKMYFFSNAQYFFQTFYKFSFKFTMFTLDDKRKNLDIYTYILFFSFPPDKKNIYSIKTTAESRKVWFFIYVWSERHFYMWTPNLFSSLIFYTCLNPSGDQGDAGAYSSHCYTKTKSTLDGLSVQHSPKLSVFM